MQRNAKESNSRILRPNGYSRLHFQTPCKFDGSLLLSEVNWNSNNCFPSIFLQDTVVNIINEHDLPLSNKESPQIEKAMHHQGYLSLNPLFVQVINDLVSSKLDPLASVRSRKHDVILQSPCGSGKSCCYVIASQLLGGLTVSREFELTIMFLVVSTNF